MIVGENAIPSANAGRIMCLSASQNMSGRPVRSVSISRNPVTTGRWNSGDRRPVNGSTPSATPNSRMKNRAHRNSGIESSTIEPKSIAGSAARPRTWNSNSPPPSPSAVAIAMAITASSTVAGSVEATRLATLRRKWIEVPKSP